MRRIAHIWLDCVGSAHENMSRLSYSVIQPFSHSAIQSFSQYISAFNKYITYLPILETIEPVVPIGYWIFVKTFTFFVLLFLDVKTHSKHIKKLSNKLHNFSGAWMSKSYSDQKFIWLSLVHLSSYYKCMGKARKCLPTTHNLTFELPVCLSCQQTSVMPSVFLGLSKRWKLDWGSC